MKLRNAHVVATAATTDLERAKRFYSDTLALRVCSENKDRGQILYEIGDGSHLLVYWHPSHSRSSATTMSFAVNDLRETVRWLEDTGIPLEDHERSRLGVRNEHGIAEMNGEKTAWIRDPDGNLIAMVESRETVSILAGDCMGSV